MRISLTFILLALTLQLCTAQGMTTDSLGFQTFEMTEGDTTYVMKQYIIAFLKTGPNRDHHEAEAAKIQAGHLAHMNTLAEQKKICIAGPLGDDGGLRGIVIYNVATLVEAKAVVKADPAVIAGRLDVEVHPWWAAKGSKLY